MSLCVLDSRLRPSWLYPLAPLVAPQTAASPWFTQLVESPEFANLARRILDTGQAERCRLVLSRADGEQLFDLTLVPRMASGGDVTSLTACMFDITEHQRVMAALADSLECCRLAADHTYDWEYWIGPDRCLRWMSPSCERVTGRRVSDFLADQGLLEAIVHPEDRPILTRHLHAECSDAPPARLGFRILRPDGEVRWIEHICQAIHGLDGQFLGRCASNRDVTETARVQQALRESEAQFRLMFELATVGMSQADPATGRLLRVNARLCRLLGYASDELLGMTFSDLTHPEDRERDLAGIRYAMGQEGADYFVEKRYLRKDGRVVWALVNAAFIRDASGRPQRAVAAIVDVTDRHQAEARARDLAAVVECSADFIGIAELDGKAIYLNPAGRSLVGLDGAPEVRAKRLQDFLFPEDRAFVCETVLPEMMREGRWQGVFRLRHFRDGEPIAASCDILRLDDPGTGRPMHVAAVIRDIRREQAAEAALLEADRRKDEFLAMLGHELRNPMAPIRSAVEILRALLTDEDPRIAWAIEVLERQTARMGHLLDDLLDVSRIVRGRLELDLRPVPVREPMQQAVEAVDALMRTRRHRFTCELAPPEIQVEGDPARLSQILLNLLINAANYTPEGGEVWVETEIGSDELLIRVRDNGQGMTAEQIATLFGLFAPGERSPDAPADGLGLGLAIARRLTEMHGGRLDAVSEGSGLGAELRVYLPLFARPMPVPESGLEPARAADQPQPRVLLADDDADVAGALAMLLDVLGYQVDTAASGAEALDIARRRCPRIAFLDIGMPGMNGLELARRLREAFPDRERLRLVALTGLGHEQARERSLAAGFDEHLVKPIDRKTLLAQLEGLI